jgi:hypothetical protein
MSVIKDLIADHTITRTADGFETERVYMVEVRGGLAETKLYNALTTAGVPQYNDPHPTLPDVRVTRIQARPATGHSPNTFRVVVTYTIPEADDALSEAEDDLATSGKVTFNTSLASEKTWFDINGDFLTVRWRGGTIVTVYKEAEVQRPQLEVAFRRVETSAPKSEILNYLGKVNSGPWSGFPAKTWLCTRIDADQEKAGKFEVDYGFSYRPETWRLEVIANLTAEQIAELPPDVESANGYQLYDVYQTADFNQLNLNF